MPTVYLVDDEDVLRDALAWLLRSRRLLSEGYAAGEAFEAMLEQRTAVGHAACRATPAVCCWTCACPA